MGHFAEGAGEHYVCLADTIPLELPQDSDQLTDIETSHETENDIVGDTHAYNNVNTHTPTPNANNHEEDGPFLNNDILEDIIKETINLYPSMRPTLRMVSRFFKNCVDKIPLPEIYLPELADVADIRHVSLRKIIKMKGKSSAVVIRLRELIASVNWINAWISLVFHGLGWYGVRSIYWKKRP